MPGLSTHDKLVIGVNMSAAGLAIAGLFSLEDERLTERNALIFDITSHVLTAGVTLFANSSKDAHLIAGLANTARLATNVMSFFSGGSKIIEAIDGIIHLSNSLHHDDEISTIQAAP